MRRNWHPGRAAFVGAFIGLVLGMVPVLLGTTPSPLLFLSASVIAGALIFGLGSVVRNWVIRLRR